MSNAGLIRYFDEEKSRYQLDPKTVAAAGTVFSVGVIVGKALLGV